MSTVNEHVFGTEGVLFFPMKLIDGVVSSMDMVLVFSWCMADLFKASLSHTHSLSVKKEKKGYYLGSCICAWLVCTV